MTTMKAILYSGGLDSYIGYWLLKRKHPTWLPVYFDLGTRYSNMEKEAISRQSFVDKFWYEVVDTIRLGSMEQPGAYIPQRNVILCAAAQARYDADEIALCSVADDVYRDNEIAFHTKMSELLSHTAGKYVRVFSPLIGRSKAQAVEWYLSLGGNPEALRRTASCYNPTGLEGLEHCGDCKACIRWRAALAENSITV